MGADWHMMGYFHGNYLVWHAGNFWDVNDITGISINWIEDQHCDNILRVVGNGILVEHFKNPPVWFTSFIHDIYIYIYQYVCMFVCDVMWWNVVIWYDMIWYDMKWYDMIWNDMIWYDMLCMYVSIYLSIYLSMYLCIYISMYLCMYRSHYIPWYFHSYVKWHHSSGRPPKPRTCSKFLARRWRRRGGDFGIMLRLGPWACFFFFFRWNIPLKNGCFVLKLHAIICHCFCIWVVKCRKWVSVGRHVVGTSSSFLGVGSGRTLASIEFSIWGFP